MQGKQFGQIGQASLCLRNVELERWLDTRLGVGWSGVEWDVAGWSGMRPESCQEGRGGGPSLRTYIAAALLSIY